MYLRGDIDLKSATRYIVATAGVVLHLMIGSVYAWSVYSSPIIKETGWSESAVSFAFSIAIFFLGMSAAFMGHAVEKFGPRVTGSVSALCYGSGMLLTGLAIHSHSLALLYLGYGFVGGTGLGSGYVTPISTIIKWFPDKKGLAAGLAIMGFGFAAMLTSPIAQALMDSVNVVNTFYILGIAYFIFMIIAAQFIRKPRPGEVPEAELKENESRSLTGAQLTANQAVKTPTFIFLWIMFFINITCGIGLVSAASPMAQEMTSMSATAAALMVGIIGLFNGFGRLVWATLSDYLGRPFTFTLIFVVDILMLGSMLFLNIQFVFVVALCLLLSCYGAGFSCIPPYLSDVFGTKQLGAIHGYILTAWGVAGMVGPVILSWTHQVLHSYSVTLITFILIDAVALIMAIAIRATFKHVKSYE